MKRTTKAQRTKRFFLSLLCALCVFVVLFGCSSHRENGAGDANLLYFSMPPDEVGLWRELSDQFEKLNPDIKIRIDESPQTTNSRETLYTTSLLSGEITDDLLYLDIIWTPKFAAAGWLEDLTDLYSKEEWSDFLAGGLAASTYRSQIYRVPMRSDAGLLYYRKDLIEQAGLAPPQTFEEMVEISRRLQQPPR